MENLRISINLVDGSDYPIEYSSGQELAEAWFGEVVPPPVVLLIQATAEDGRSVVFRISCDERPPIATVSISE